MRRLIFEVSRGVEISKARAKWGSGRNNRHRPGREKGYCSEDEDRDTQHEMEAN